MRFNPYSLGSIERELERVRSEYINSGPDQPGLDKEANRALRQ